MRSLWDWIVAKYEDFIDRLFIEDPVATRKMLERAQTEVERGIQDGEKGLATIRAQLKRAQSDLSRKRSQYNDLSAVAQEHVEKALRLRIVGKEIEADKEDQRAYNIAPTLSSLEEQIRDYEVTVAELEETERGCSQVLERSYSQKATLVAKHEMAVARVLGRKMLREATTTTRVMHGLLVKANSTLQTSQRIVERAGREYQEAMEEHKIVSRRVQVDIQTTTPVEGRSIIAEMKKRAAAKYQPKPEAAVREEKEQEEAK